MPVTGKFSAPNVLMIRGEKEAGLARLRDAIDEGWLSDARFFFDDPYLELWIGPVVDDPRFIAMAQEVEDKIRAEREWYEENKDKPLL